MLCESPRHKAETGLVFELEFNGGVYDTQTGLTYSYYNDVQINYLDPAFISMDAATN